MATATMTSKGQLTVPKEIRERLGCEPGDKVELVPMARRPGDHATQAASVSLPSCFGSPAQKAPFRSARSDRRGDRPEAREWNGTRRAMIGLDTNSCVRVLATRTTRRRARPRAAGAAWRRPGEPAWVNHVVLCELAWVLREATTFARAQIADLIDNSCRRGRARGRALVAEALGFSARTRADFADALIGVLNRRAGCETTYTFDRAGGTADFTGVP